MPNHPSPPGSLSRRATPHRLGGRRRHRDSPGAARSPDGLSGKTEVKQWNLLAGADGAVMTEMHDQFSTEHPDIELEATTFGWGTPFYTRLVMGASGGNASDIATIHLSRLRSVSPDTLLDPITMRRANRPRPRPRRLPREDLGEVLRRRPAVRPPDRHARPRQLLQQGPLRADRRPRRRRHAARDQRRRGVLRHAPRRQGNHRPVRHLPRHPRRLAPVLGLVPAGRRRDDLHRRRLRDGRRQGPPGHRGHVQDVRRGPVPALRRRRPVRRQLRERRRRLRPGRQLGDQPLQALRRGEPRLVLHDRDAELLRQPPHPGRLPLLCAPVPQQLGRGRPRGHARLRGLDAPAQLPVGRGRRPHPGLPARHRRRRIPGAATELGVLRRRRERAVRPRGVVLRIRRPPRSTRPARSSTRSTACR